MKSVTSEKYIFDDKKNLIRIIYRVGTKTEPNNFSFETENWDLRNIGNIKWTEYKRGKSGNVIKET